MNLQIDTRDTTEAIKEIHESRVPMSLRVLPSRPAAWAAGLIALAKWGSDRMPGTHWGTAGGLLIFLAAGFILFWNARVRRDYHEWRNNRKP